MYVVHAMRSCEGNEAASSTAVAGAAEARRTRAPILEMESGDYDGGGGAAGARGAAGRLWGPYVTHSLKLVHD